jgi:CHASE2 domain-containing sensor protein
MSRLREQGVATSAIDLSFSGSQSVSIEQWYVDLLDTLIDSFSLDLDLEVWWGAQRLRSPLMRFYKFIDEILLVQVTNNIVIFIDEIDSVLSLKFPTDDFFAFIRACYNQRADKHQYKRLTFCLLGVASPSQLMKDKKRTPFNIGEAIVLKGFQLHEVEPLKKVMEGKVNDPQAVMTEILDWTGGQPFLTQKLCKLMLEETSNENPQPIKRIVYSRIVDNWEFQDTPEHLQTIRDRILANGKQAMQLLRLYQKILKNGQIVTDDSPEQRQLCLSGIVVQENGALRVNNSIYGAIFTLNWVEEELFRLHAPTHQWLPTVKEVRWLLVFLFLSLLPFVQDLLLEPRLLLQAIYRQITAQLPINVESPLLLVKIDNRSLIADKIRQRYPIDYNYLAQIIQALSDTDARIIGIDYILDQAKQQPQNTQRLNQTIRSAVAKKTWFVFGRQSYEDPNKGRVSQEIASLSWSMEGNISFYQWYVELLPSRSSCYEDCPFSYLLALTYSLQNQDNSLADLPQPNLLNQQDFRFSVINPKNIHDKQTDYLYRLRLLPISTLLGWFNPLIDFSLPASRAYQSTSACELLQSCQRRSNVFNNLHQRIVIIAPGGYEEAGLKGEGEDNYDLPLAVAFWQGWGKGTISGGEAHAYMIHHLLMRRLVTPVPDCLMILLLALVGKSITLMLKENSNFRQKYLLVLGGITTVYLFASLQIYISAAILFPCVLPSLTLWNYVRLALQRKVNN